MEDKHRRGALPDVGLLQQLQGLGKGGYNKLTVNISPSNPSQNTWQQPQQQQASVGQRSPESALLTLPDFAEENFDLRYLVARVVRETIKKDPNGAFDPVAHIEAFKSAITRLEDLMDRNDSTILRLNTNAIDIETTHENFMKSVRDSFDSIFTAFRRVDKRISKVSEILVRIGSLLEVLTQQRKQYAFSKTIIQHFISFAVGKLEAIDEIFRSEDPEEQLQAAFLIQTLQSLVAELSRRSRKQQSGSQSSSPAGFPATSSNSVSARLNTVNDENSNSQHEGAHASIGSIGPQHSAPSLTVDVNASSQSPASPTGAAGPLSTHPTSPVSGAHPTSSSPIAGQAPPTGGLSSTSSPKQPSLPGLDPLIVTRHSLSGSNHLPASVTGTQDQSHLAAEVLANVSAILNEARALNEVVLKKQFSMYVKEKDTPSAYRVMAILQNYRGFVHTGYINFATKPLEKFLEERLPKVTRGTLDEDLGHFVELATKICKVQASKIIKLFPYPAQTLGHIIKRIITELLRPLLEKTLLDPNLEPTVAVALSKMAADEIAALHAEAERAAAAAAAAASSNTAAAEGINIFAVPASPSLTALQVTESKIPPLQKEKDRTREKDKSKDKAKESKHREKKAKADKERSEDPSDGRGRSDTIESSSSFSTLSVSTTGGRTTKAYDLSQLPPIPPVLREVDAGREFLRVLDIATSHLTTLGSKLCEIAASVPVHANAYDVLADYIEQAPTPGESADKAQSASLIKKKPSRSKSKAVQSTDEDEAKSSITEAQSTSASRPPIQVKLRDPIPYVLGFDSQCQLVSHVAGIRLNNAGTSAGLSSGSQRQNKPSGWRTSSTNPATLNQMPDLRSMPSLMQMPSLLALPTLDAATLKVPPVPGGEGGQALQSPEASSTHAAAASLGSDRLVQEIETSITEILEGPRRSWLAVEIWVLRHLANEQIEVIRASRQALLREEKGTFGRRRRLVMPVAQHTTWLQEVLASSAVNDVLAQATEAVRRSDRLVEVEERDAAIDEITQFVIAFVFDTFLAPLLTEALGVFELHFAASQATEKPPNHFFLLVIKFANEAATNVRLFFQKHAAPRMQDPQAKATLEARLRERRVQLEDVVTRGLRATLTSVVRVSRKLLERQKTNAYNISPSDQAAFFEGDRMCPWQPSLTLIDAAGASASSTLAGASLECFLQHLGLQTYAFFLSHLMKMQGSVSPTGAIMLIQDLGQLVRLVHGFGSPKLIKLFEGLRSACSVLLGPAEAVESMLHEGPRSNAALIADLVKLRSDFSQHNWSWLATFSLNAERATVDDDDDGFTLASVRRARSGGATARGGRRSSLIAMAAGPRLGDAASTSVDSATAGEFDTALRIRDKKDKKDKKEKRDKKDKKSKSERGDVDGKRTRADKPAKHRV